MALIDIDKYSKLVITAKKDLEFKAPVDGSFNAEMVSIASGKKVEFFANDGTTKLKEFTDSTSKEEWLFEYKNASWTSKKLTTNTPIKKDVASAFIKSGRNFLTEGETYDAGLNRFGDNMCLGTAAGESNTKGTRNTFIGIGAGKNNTTGVDNTFIGKDAGRDNVTGKNNTVIGASAAYFEELKDDNTIIGYKAGEDCEGTRNTFVGKDAGKSSTTGGYNTYIGEGAGQRSSTADSNTFIGNRAGANVSTGDRNVFIGQSAGSDTGNAAGNGNIAIGANVNVSTGHPSYEINIGNRIRWNGTRLQVNVRSLSNGAPDTSNPNWRNLT